MGYCALASGCRSIIAAPCSAYLDHLVDFPQGFLEDILFNQKTSLHPRPSAADMPRSLALFSCSNPRLPFDLSPFPLKYIYIYLHISTRIYNIYLHISTYIYIYIYIHTLYIYIHTYIYIFACFSNVQHIRTDIFDILTHAPEKASRNDPHSSLKKAGGFLQ